MCVKEGGIKFVLGSECEDYWNVVCFWAKKNDKASVPTTLKRRTIVCSGSYHIFSSHYALPCNICRDELGAPFFLKNVGSSLISVVWLVLCLLLLQGNSLNFCFIWAVDPPSLLQPNGHRVQRFHPSPTLIHYLLRVGKTREAWQNLCEAWQVKVKLPFSFL